VIVIWDLPPLFVKQSAAYHRVSGEIMVYTQEQLKRYSRQIAMEEVGIAGQ